MLHIRLEGDEGEARALMEALRAAGCDVLVGTVKARREGFSHLYGSVAMPGWRPSVRATATTGPAEAPPVRARRPRRAIEGRGSGR
ncbi:hypothetical protein ACIBJE_01990 [Micromonospora sp. NPDC050187]|uniref:hypothetical protein n=1 Tax=Micromonospora sp. NPDC050187 TaxID=3364277 RepID=UPI0037AF5707